MMVGRGHRGRPGGGGRVGRGGRPASELPPTDDLAAWLAGRLPDGWFTGAPEVTVDREEILVVGELPAPEDAADADAAAARRRARPVGSPVPRGDPRGPHGDRPAGRAPLRAQGGLGRADRGHRRRRRRGGALHDAVRAGDDAAAPARAARPGHPGRRRGGPLALGGPGVGGGAGGRPHRAVARRAARGHEHRRRAPCAGPASRGRGRARRTARATTGRRTLRRRGPARSPRCDRSPRRPSPRGRTRGTRTCSATRWAA